jgi:RHS repeat-associated protein
VVAPRVAPPYAYDSRDCLIRVTQPDSTIIRNMYDPDSRRVQQTVGGQTTDYLWDEASLYGDVVLETDAAGATLASYVLGGTELLSQERGGVPSYYLHDGQGSVRGLVEGADTITDSYSYTAFGELLDETGSTVNSYLYTAQQYDALTGLYRLRARYYDPGLGRFLGRDPAEMELFNPRELNRYVYAANDPVNLEDPTGLLAVEYETQSQQSLEEAQALRWVVYPAWEVHRTPWYIYILRALGVTAALGGPLACGLLCPGPVPLPEPQPIPEAPPLPRPETQPKPQPEETPPPPEPTETPQGCDSSAFTSWWFSLVPVLGSARPGQDWYEYEQRVARASGLLGDYTRRVTAGPIDADGIQPRTCRFVEAKYSADPVTTQWRLDGPPWAAQAVLAALVRYRVAVSSPNGVPGAQPFGIIVRKSFEVSRLFFEQLLVQAGFALGVDGTVEVVP